ARQQPLDPRLARVPRDHHGDDGEGRIAPHRPDVAQAAGQRLVADLLGLRGAAVEMDAVDDAVGLEEQMAAAALQDRGVVARIDDDPSGALPDAPADPADEVEFRHALLLLPADGDEA